jgi:hypothetical protein
MLGPWANKCINCANYSGSPRACGFCRVWGAVIPQDAPITRQCPHWTSRVALRLAVAARTVG